MSNCEDDILYKQQLWNPSNGLKIRQSYSMSVNNIRVTNYHWRFKPKRYYLMYIPVRVGKPQCATHYKQRWYYHFIVMNHTMPNSTQTWVTETVNHHSMYPDLFTGNHLLTAQKPAKKCYVVDSFFGMIAQQSVYYTLLDVVGGLRTIKNRTKNLCLSIRWSSNLGFWILCAE